VDRIAIRSTVFVPKSLGMNDDVRPLGIDLAAIRFEAGGR
jgi:hypothetical protein